MSNQFKQKFDLFVENCTVHRIKDLDWGCKVNDNRDLGKVGARACPWSFFFFLSIVFLWCNCLDATINNLCLICFVSFLWLQSPGQGSPVASSRTHARGLTSRCHFWYNVTSVMPDYYQYSCTGVFIQSQRVFWCWVIKRQMADVNPGHSFVRFSTDC